ncbi:hypothetical protein [Pseudomonas akapageensis]|uniref:hypothetical protein n=1 Tax=Pseudomonas akapageensis TaxID=2609961 RepID=UPI00140A9804|nr:hypothetical protein [Pseudomonas akapageensis]
MKSTPWNMEFATLAFTPGQATQLDAAARHMARAGGPQSIGVRYIAKNHAEGIASTFDPAQSAIAQRFADGQLAALAFEGMCAPQTFDLPDALPELNRLEEDFTCIQLASRNQIFLELVKHKAFAYDIDNAGKISRLVGNFKGGGQSKLPNENLLPTPELSSHAGLCLGAHTEAPYHCSVHASNGHSPAPSALIMTARWNPAGEPTYIIPMREVIESIGSLAALALTSNSFNFTRSDCFVEGLGESGTNISILQFDENGGFAIRYNAYRFSVSDNATAPAIEAFQRLHEQLHRTQGKAYDLQPHRAVAINNSRALHARNVIKDNRRLLIRLFGYSSFASPIVLNDDPLLVQG